MHDGDSKRFDDLSCRPTVEKKSVNQSVTQEKQTSEHYKINIVDVQRRKGGCAWVDGWMGTSVGLFVCLFVGMLVPIPDIIHGVLQALFHCSQDALQQRDRG